MSELFLYNLDKKILEQNKDSREILNIVLRESTANQKEFENLLNAKSTVKNNWFFTEEPKIWL